MSTQIKESSRKSRRYAGSLLTGRQNLLLAEQKVQTCKFYSMLLMHMTLTAGQPVLLIRL